MEGMDMSRLLAGGAIGGVLITLVTVFWRKIKASWHYVTGLLVQRMVIRLDARYSMMSYLARYGKVSRFRDIFVSAYSEVVKRGHYELTSFEPICLNGTNLIWLGNVPVMITIGGSDKGSISDNGNMPGVIHLSFLRGTIDPDKLVKKATEEYNLTSQNNWVLKANSRKRFFVKRIPEAAAGTSQSKGSTPDRNETSIQWYQFSFNRLISHNVDDLGNPVNCNGKALENLFFPAHIEKMQQEIVLWRSKREWYFQRGLPWKRGWLLHGSPGCLHPNTPVFDPVDGTSLTVKERFDLRKPFNVLSIDAKGNVVTAEAEAPHQYKLAKMLTVTLADGNSFTVTPHHKVRVGEDWIEVADVARRLLASEPVLIQTTSVPSLSTRNGDAPRSKKTGGGSSDDYPGYPCSDGVRLPREEEVVQSFSPSLVCAQQHSLAKCDTGDQDNICSDTPQRLCFRPSNWGYSLPSVLQTAGVFLSHTLPGIFVTAWCSCHKLLQLDSKTSRKRTSLLRLHVVLESIVSALSFLCNWGKTLMPAGVGVDSVPVESLSGVALNRTVADAKLLRRPASEVLRPFVDPRGWQLYGIPVVSVEEKPDEVYYDFHVPVHENYWACGAFHHNTGKTSLARAFAQDLDMPVFVFSLGELSNSEFRRKWMEMQTNVPCIALIEDIDGVFHGRKNISGGNAEMSAFLRNAEMMGRDGQDGQGGDGEDTISQPKEASGEDGEGRQQRQMRRPQIPMNSGLTFDCLLNVLDGVERLEGVFVIITTNDITKVDPAIGQPTGDNGSTRPGRIDRVIELRNMAKFDKCRMAKRILSDFPDDLEKLIDKVNNDPNEPEQSPCQFQERCSQIALQRLWDVEGEALKREV